MDINPSPPHNNVTETFAKEGIERTLPLDDNKQAYGKIFLK